ncbi:DnaD domain protein [Thermicanus aegyptius]|uniref:DnaD domain protein n=1 Tax=Thermicanus aegyptius TaxID=94009 RepID=UPI0004072D20|nr:DnaD domain protein [Thermicanus aegyptius]
MIVKELLPQTVYRLRMLRPLAESELRVITQFYLPIIQQEAYSLYLFFYHSLSPDRGVGEEQTHLYIFQMMGMELPRFLKARKRLEGVGLLSTYRVIEKEAYEYLLRPPLTPYEFVQSDVLALSLLNRLGKEGYRKLRERFQLSPSLSWDFEEKKEEVTISFKEVAQELMMSDTPPQVSSESVQFLRRFEEGRKLPPLSSTGEPLSPKIDLDFEYLAGFYPREERDFLFSEENKGRFLRYALLYGLDSMEMGLLLKDSYLDGKRGWDLVRFEELAKKMKRRDQGAMGSSSIRDAHPRVSGETRPVQREMREPKSVEEHLRNLKSITPYQLLRNYQDGGEISQPDQKLLDYLLHDLALPSEVVNVLIDFILLTNDNKLPGAYTEKIAGSWKRKGFKTAEEAFTFARQEYWRNMAKQSGIASPTNGKETKENKARRKGEKRREVPRYIWLQAEQDAKAEKEREEMQREATVNLEEVKQLIDELEEKG